MRHPIFCQPDGVIWFQSLRLSCGLRAMIAHRSPEKLTFGSRVESLADHRQSNATAEGFSLNIEAILRVRLESDARNRRQMHCLDCFLKT
jgi:hypothetical protein